MQIRLHQTARLEVYACAGGSEQNTLIHYNINVLVEQYMKFAN